MTLQEILEQIRKAESDTAALKRWAEDTEVDLNAIGNALQDYLAIEEKP